MTTHAPLTPALPHLVLDRPEKLALEEALTHEWLVANGVGGYAASTVALCNTRKYHGLFTPSLYGRGRTVMLARMDEELCVAGTWHRLDGEENTARGVECPGLPLLRRFELHGLLPEWTFEVNGTSVLRRLVLVHGENTLYVAYTHQSGPAAGLRLRPYPTFRSHEGHLSHGQGQLSVHIEGPRVELKAAHEAVPLRIRLHSHLPVPFVSLENVSAPQHYRIEHSRGYECTETLRSPGYFDATLAPGETVALSVSTQEWTGVERTPVSVFALELERERRILERAPQVAQKGTAARLVLAADQFIIEPSNRPQDEAWARASGQDARSIIAGYHWFTDWGRDTMISFEGLTLATGRHREAGAILRTFQHYVRDGLLPNFFPDGEHQGVYHTADATLWYFHAIHRYLMATGDQTLLRDLFPTLEDIVRHHVRGTRFNIHVDPKDGLLHQGEEGYQLTWMDAKVDGWVVTPRRGKAVEINALWFNAVSLMAEWATTLERDPSEYLRLAEEARRSFNHRFWNPAEGCLLDVVDGEPGQDGTVVRPNQIFSISLQHAVLDRARWASVLGKVRDELLTPVGLRTLSPRHPDYKPKYDGDLRSRDAAYHQGTVWPWLLGHFVDAQLKLEPDKSLGRGLLLGLERHLQQTCLGQVSEIFDATNPFRPRGCVAQAWSVAEMLRVWLKTS